MSDEQRYPIDDDMGEVPQNTDPVEYEPEIIDEPAEAAWVVRSAYVDPDSQIPRPPEPSLGQDLRTFLAGIATSRQSIVVFALLLVIIGAGYTMRSIGRNWDDYTHLHPDERFLTDIVTKIRSGRALNPARLPPGVPDPEPAQQIAYCDAKYPAPSSEDYASMTPEEQMAALQRVGKGPYFDARCSDLNPNKVDPTIWVYGEFPLFAVRVLGETYNQISADDPAFELTGTPWTGYNGAHLVGRAMNAAFDTLSILLVFLIGSRLFGRWPGLLAAAFYAFATFPIQQSHYWTVDAFTSFWVVLAIYFAVRVMQQASLFPERFTWLPWITSGVVIWLWDIDSFGRDYMASIAIYLGVMLLIGGLTMLATEQLHKNGLERRKITAIISLGLAIVGYALFEVAYLATELAGDEYLLPLSLRGAQVAGLVTALLVGFTVYGWQRYGSFTGLFPWLGTAFALWVFDYLAHYGPNPGVILLGVYLLVLTGVGLLASGLRYYSLYPDDIDWLAWLLLPILFLFMGIVLGLAVISVWGVVALVCISALLAGATYFGLQDELAFGLAFGASLAGRINILPLVGVFALALIIRSLPLLNWRMFRHEKNYHFTRLIVGALLAGFATFLAFRTLQPHAFYGPSFLGFIDLDNGVLNFNDGWTSDVAEAQHLVSGNADIPPNWQWTNRTKWLFPWQNIVLYGLGLPLGLAAWGGFAWSLVKIARAQRHWTRLAIPTAWVLVYFGWLGQNWVSTMRYFMPIYGMLCLFAAWGLIELILTAWRFWRAMPASTLRRLAPAAATLLVIFVMGYTAIYGYGSTRIATTQLTRVALSRYMQEFIPGDVGLTIEEADGNSRMVNLAVWSGGFQPQIVRLSDLGEKRTIEFKPSFSSNLESLTLFLVGDPLRDPGLERLRVRVYSTDSAGAEAILGGQLIEADFGQSLSKYGSDYTILFSPAIPLLSDQSRKYYVDIELLDGGPVTIARRVTDSSVPPIENHLVLNYQDTGGVPDTLPIQGLDIEMPAGARDVAYFNPGTITGFDFLANATGEIRQLVVPHVSDPMGDADDETLRIILRDNRLEDSTGFETEGRVTGDFNTDNGGLLFYGPSLTIDLDAPFPVEAGHTYSLNVEASDLLGVGGSTVAWEGPWDDPMPTVVCPTPDGMRYEDELPSGLCTLTSAGMNLYSGYYIGLTMNMFWPDEESKRQDLLNLLDKTDYIVIGSNRFYDGFNRIPTRWPMSVHYYETLFSGELGFELVKTFTSYARFGPFEWPDQVLPTEGLFNSRNEYEAEEAYHVYTHPASFIFRKTPNYSAEKAAAILNVNIRSTDNAAGMFVSEAEPVNRINWGSLEASRSPTAFQFTPEQREIQREGGTWSDLFDRMTFYNRNQVAAVVVWWLLMMLVGWITLPLLHFIFPGLPDRGFGAAKLLGWIIIAWTAWFASSFELKLWSQVGLAAVLGGFAVLNLMIAIMRREQLLAFIKTRWRHLLVIEIISAILFLFFVGIRIGNPDLWHSNFGGEKPMNFAYFNGVLRSTIFPPVDPWFSNGYINYYYWGYVLVGAPTKLLGIVPSIAYNLILPTLYSMTGIGAFSVAFNLVAWSQERRLENSQPDSLDPTPLAENETPRYREKSGPTASPYVAGVAALMLAVVLGNLDTIRVLATGVAASGGWPPGGVATIEQPLITNAVTQFQAENGRPPTEEELKQISDDVGLSRIDATRQWFDALWDGFKNVSSGKQPLGVAANRWYWGPRSVILELSGDRGHGAITEMPYFTFLYGDLHAHMMAMPLTLLVVLGLTAEILGAGRKLRNWLGTMLALFVLGLVAGVLRPTNTWDWPTYMLLGVAGLTFAAWVGQGRLQAHLPPLPLYIRLRRFLDLRYIVRLWPLLLAIPIGMMVRGGLHVYQSREYETQLQNGEIPVFCQNIDFNTVDKATISPLCEGKLEPHLGIADVIVWGIGALGAVAMLYAAGLVLLGHRFDRDALLSWIASLGLFGVFSVFAIWPYNTYFATAYGKLLPWESDKTPLWAYLDIHGIFIFILLSMLLWQTGRWLRGHRVQELRGLGVPLLIVVGAVPLTLLVSLYIGLGEYRVFLLTIPMLVWTAILFLLPGQSAVERWVYILIGLALVLSMAVEMVVLQGDNGRQNSVFKFYIQIWLLFSVAGGVSLAWLIRSVERWTPALSGAWQMILAVLLSLGLLYPITASQGRFQDRFDKARTPTTLDGMEFMKYATQGEDPDGNGPIPGVWFNLNGDYYLIRWMQDHIQGTPNIIEAWHTEYHWTSRVAIHTGLPTVLGWRYHQSQQRNLPNLDRLLTSRLNNIDAFYTSPDIGVAWNLIQFYNTEYIVLGSFERIIYEDVKDPVASDPTPMFRSGQSEGIAKFQEMVDLGLLEVAYERQVCIHPNIYTIADCPTERINTDYVYHVVPTATYSSGTEAAQVIN